MNTYIPPDNYDVDWIYIYNIKNEILFHFYPTDDKILVWQLRFEIPINNRKWKIAKILDEAMIKYYIEIFKDRKQKCFNNRLLYETSDELNFDDVINKFGKFVYQKLKNK